MDTHNVDMRKQVRYTAGELGGYGEGNRGKVGRRRYEEQARKEEEQPIVVVTSNWKKSQQTGSRMVVNPHQRSMQLLQAPSYEDLKRRLHS